MVILVHSDGFFCSDAEDGLFHKHLYFMFALTLICHILQCFILEKQSVFVNMTALVAVCSENEFAAGAIHCKNKADMSVSRLIKG